MQRYASLHERLIRNSRRENDCCLWEGYCQSGYVSEPGTLGSYGRINLTKEGRSLKFPVHRVSKVLEEILILYPEFDFYKPKDKKIFFELYSAYSACGLSIDHLCKNSLCINPTHLEWVHLTKNQQRKKWSTRERKVRIKRQNERRTRHYTSLSVTTNILTWIKKIQQKGYRIK